MKKENKPSITTVLRQKVEALLNNRPLKEAGHLSEAETMRLLHELEVHQVELEIQNEELNMARAAAQNVAQKYAELYDFAPSGYFTISKDGKIRELNLSGAEMLDKERSNLINSQFSLFVTDDTKPIFNLFLYKVFTGNTKETCEVSLIADDKSHETNLLLTGIATGNEEQCLISAVDITERKQAEETIKRSRLFLMSSLESLKNTKLLFGDENYRYLYFNKAHSISMKHAYNADIKIGMNILDCITSDIDRKSFRENYDRALKGESNSNMRISGEVEYAYYENFFNPIVNDKNEISGVTVLSINITERKRAEAALEKWANIFKPKAN